jgi:hypothetical protein
MSTLQMKPLGLALCFFVMIPIHALAAPVPYLFKWKDASGVTHVTDRIDDVPAAIREGLKKRVAALEEARKNAKKSNAPEAKPTTPPPPPVTEKTAYEKYQARLARERSVKERATDLREQLTRFAEQTAALEEEQGTLRTNPTMNIAIPARGARMTEIDTELGTIKEEKAKVLSKVAALLKEVELHDEPDGWVTNLD